MNQPLEIDGVTHASTCEVFQTPAFRTQRRPCTCGATRHGAAIACTVAAGKRPSYEEAVKHRPRGACYCDLDDRACYAAGHWEAGCTWTNGPCRTVRCTNCPFYSSGLRN